jgi:cysteinyl-tRNA synthetase
MLCTEFTEAMDDDLSVPAALAALQGVIREGNKLLAEGDSPALRGNLAAVRRMLSLLGLDPLDATWAQRDGDDKALRSALDTLVAALVAQRDEARARRDFTTADAIRHQLRDAGVEVEDTPSGSRWTLTASSRSADADGGS